MSFVNSMAISALTTVLTAAPLAAESFKTVFPGTYQQLTDEFRSGVDALDLQQGKIVLPGATAELTLPDGYYFLNASDSRYVLEKAWGNPQDSTLLGLILPRKISPFDAGSWAVTLQFDDIGYVSDADAGTHDYDEMLATMRADLTAENDWRLQNGFAKVASISS